MVTRQLQDEVITNMRRWQGIEDAVTALTAQVIQETQNPVVRLIMEIIQRDSQIHHRIEDWIADTMKYKTVTLTPEELVQVWKLIEHHMELERKVVEIAEETLDSLRGDSMVIQRYLTEFLLEDERKHSNLLNRLDNIKKGMYVQG